MKLENDNKMIAWRYKLDTDASLCGVLCFYMQNYSRETNYHWVCKWFESDSIWKYVETC